MRFFKTVFAIFASVLLAGSQSVLALGQNVAAPAQECVCCNCKQTDCCVAPSSAPTQPAPVSPARPLSQSALQLIAVVTAFVLPLPENTAQSVTSTSFSAPHATAVPLYEWNCSYLI